MSEYYRLGLLVGAKLRYLRQQKNMAPEAAAAALGLGVDELGEIERGARIANAAVLHRIASVFDCELSSLFYWPAMRGDDSEIKGQTAHPEMGQSREIDDQGMALLRSFSGIADPFMREEILKITSFLARYSQTRPV